MRERPTVDSPRFSREDLARAVKEMGNYLGSSPFVTVTEDRFKLWRAMLSEAANRAPTEDDLLALEERPRLSDTWHATQMGDRKVTVFTNDPKAFVSALHADGNRDVEADFRNLLDLAFSEPGTPHQEGPTTHTGDGLAPTAPGYHNAGENDGQLAHQHPGNRVPPQQGSAGGREPDGGGLRGLAQAGGAHDSGGSVHARRGGGPGEHGRLLRGSDAHEHRRPGGGGSADPGVGAASDSAAGSHTGDARTAGNVPPYTVSGLTDPGGERAENRAPAVESPTQPSAPAEGASGDRGGGA